MSTTPAQRPMPLAQTGVANQIPRNALALLMVGQLLVLLPHMWHQSLWLMAVALICGLWRTQVHRGHWSYPGRNVKALLAGLAFVGVVISSSSGISLESATALLLVGFALKLLEMKHRRDAYLVIFLGYFVIATAFLFSQALALALYQVLATIVVTAAMIGLNQVHSEVRPGLSLKTASLLVAQALPLTLVLFLFFPRVAPLWSMPLPEAARTGIGERMTPGDVAELSQSDELAFRVSFADTVPRQSDLYFRALAYTNFAGGTWSAPGVEDRSDNRLETLRYEHALQLLNRGLGTSPTDAALSYEVLLEPTGRDWLVSLDTVLRTDAKVLRNSYLGLKAKAPLLALERYRVLSDPTVSLEPSRLARWQREEALTLPEGESPQLRALAQTRYEALGRDIDRYIAWIQEEIRTQPFRYTLSPPTLPAANSIQQFWFETRAGFCTHYAGATVFMLRSVGIPARMVVGYQGGSINALSGHLEVRQYDAHAWVEAYRDGQGWLRLDPTAAVAPERVEQGLSAALSASERGALSIFANARLGGEGLLAAALQLADSLEHRWNLWVVGFDEGQQQGILRELLGELSPTRIGFAMLAGGALSIALVSLLLFWRHRPRRRDPLLSAFQRLDELAALQGLTRAPEDTPAQILRRALNHLSVPAEEQQRLIAALTAALYNPAMKTADRAPLIGQLRRLAMRMRFAGRP